MTATSKRTTVPWWLWLASVVLVALVYYPTGTWLVTNWLANPYYTHGFVIQVVSILLAWRIAWVHRDDPTPPASAVTFIVGMVVAVAGMAVHMLALVQYRYLLSAFTLILTLPGIVLALGGWTLLRRQAFPLYFLLLMIPLPILETSTPALARWVASAATWLANTVGLNVTATGATVTMPGASLLVAAPCSGVNSLAALVTMAVLYAFLVQGPLWGRLSLVALSVPIALLGNLLRIFLLVVISYFWGSDAAMAYFHNWSSLFLYILALGLLVLIGRLLRCRALRSDIF